jgi:hypothetical protein
VLTVTVTRRLISVANSDEQWPFRFHSQTVPSRYTPMRDGGYVLGCSAALVSAAWPPMNSSPARIAGR